MLRRRGEQHEARYLAELEAEGRSVVAKIERDDDDGPGRRESARQAAETLGGHGGRGRCRSTRPPSSTARWLGYADFLLRVEHADPSVQPAGGHGTTRWRTRSSPTTSRPARCSRSAPTSISSSGSRACARARCTSCWADGATRSSQPARGRLHGLLPRREARGSRRPCTAPIRRPRLPPATRRPPPTPSRWSTAASAAGRSTCEARRRADDHLSLVAGIGAHQRKALRGRGIETLTAPGRARRCRSTRRSTAPARRPPNASASRRASSSTGAAECRPSTSCCSPGPGEQIDPERGLATLPDPSRATSSSTSRAIRTPSTTASTTSSASSMSGRHRSPPSGRSTGQPRATFNLAGEKAGLRGVHRLRQRRAGDRHPDMHVYHYAPYEPTALKRLMGRHATREDGGGRAAARRASWSTCTGPCARACAPRSRATRSRSWSRSTASTREIDLRDAGSSIVAFEEWLELGAATGPGRTSSGASRATTATTSSATAGCVTGWRGCDASLASAPDSRSRDRRRAPRSRRTR